MVEVMMLGILVALIKIAELATVIPELAMYLTGILVALLTAMTANFEPEEAWERIQWVAASEEPETRAHAGEARS